MNPAVKTLRSVAERDQLIEQYLPLVRHIAARLPVTLPASLDKDDFYSAGLIGLLHAATTFDPTRGASFKTFAYTAIRGTILDEVRKHDPVPRSRRDRLRKMDRANSTLWSELGREPSLIELAETLDCSASDLDDDLQSLHTSRVLSLDETYGIEEGASMRDQIADDRIDNPNACADDREQIDRLTRAIAELPETDRHVVVLHYHEHLYLKDIGEVLGVTESRVSQILSRATERLRLKLKG